MSADNRALQLHLLEMLKWFHSFCVENHLRYYALGGTMLGAARHKGFIPWDDDIDVGMPRTDYEKLINLIGDRKYEDYYLETPFSKAKDYRYPYSKLYDTRTTLIEHTWPVLKRGVFIDVFPLDGMGQTEEESKNRWHKISRKANVVLTKMCALNKRRALYKNIAIIIGHTIPFDYKKTLAMMQTECSNIDYEESKIAGNIFGNWGFREVMPKEVMGKPTLYCFEDTEIYGVEKHDEYLTALYGDWRKLPPKNQQTSHHDFYLDLQTPYEEFIKQISF